MRTDEDIAVVKPRKKYQHVLAMTLLSAFVLSWFIWGPFAIFFYVSGFLNLPLIFSLGPFLFLSIPAAAICVPILLVGTIARWSKLDAKEKGRRVGAMIAASALAGSFALGFAGCAPSPMNMFLRGFVRYVDQRADIATTQNWLATLQPGERQLEQVNPDIHVEESNLPQSIARLKAWYWNVTLDDAGRPRIRLMWGTGMIGSWGLVVGDSQMATPASDFSRHGEVRQTIAPGAYVWYEVR